MANPGPAIAGIPNTELAFSSTPLQRVIAPLPLTGTVAAVNGSLGIQYFPCNYPISASRLDALYNLSFGTAATSATGAIPISAYGGIYSSFISSNSTGGSTSALSLLSYGTTQTTYSMASNGSGQSQLSVAGIRPISVPINVNMTQGEYYIAWAISSTQSSVGAATTTLAFSMSNLLGGSNQSAVAYAEITAATNATSNLQGFQGVYSATVSALPVTIAQANINQTGANQAYGQFAFVLRNY